MLRRNRIPEKDTEFSNYIYRTTAALLNGTPPTWQRLRLFENDKNKWIDFMNQWDDMYPKHVNASQRTKVVTAEKNRIKKEFTQFAQPLLNQMSGSYATVGDRLTFNLRKKERPYHKRGKIEDAPTAHVQSIGGGSLRIRVRRENQEGRSGKHPLADVLEVSYWYGHRVITVPLEQCIHKHFSTKTYFILKLPQDAIGKWIYFYFRWTNHSKHENSGPYSQMQVAVVG
jgi:hypothetical protein